MTNDSVNPQRDAINSLVDGADEEPTTTAFINDTAQKADTNKVTDNTPTKAPTLNTPPKQNETLSSNQMSKPDESNINLSENKRTIIINENGSAWAFGGASGR